MKDTLRCDICDTRVQLGEKVLVQYDNGYYEDETFTVSCVNCALDSLDTVTLDLIRKLEDTPRW